MGVITWNGVASNTIGVIVEKFPNYNGAARKYETVSVPGRNGSLLFDLGGYENFIQEYEIAVIGTGPTVARDVRNWLCGVVGYATLEDSYDSGYFRNAYFLGPLNIENVLNKAGRATIQFMCQPERYLKSANNYSIACKVADTPNLTYSNPYNTVAKPIIRLEKVGSSDGSGVLTWTFGTGGSDHENILVNSWNANYLYIDCQIMDVYNSVNVVQAGALDLGPHGFPYIPAGMSGWSITFDSTSNITEILVKPRWWTI